MPSPIPVHSWCYLFSSFLLFFFFFLNDPPTPEIYPLPLPAPLPIYRRDRRQDRDGPQARRRLLHSRQRPDREGRAGFSARRPQRIHQARSDLCVRLQQPRRSEEHTSELQSQSNLVCRLLLEKKKKKK